MFQVRLLFHLLWTTKARAPLIDADLEPLIYGAITREAQRLGAQVLAVNGMPDHLHVILEMPPTLAPADCVGKLKSASSLIFTMQGRDSYHWNHGFAICTLDDTVLEELIRYVEQQKQVHRSGGLKMDYEMAP